MKTCVAWTLNASAASVDRVPFSGEEGKNVTSVEYSINEGS